MRAFMLPTAVAFATILKAQCPFNVVISPTTPILCPGESILLSTSESYEAYQWYRDSAPIAGAQGPSLEVDYLSGAGSIYHLEATREGCTAPSAPAFVDGWVFLPPFVISEGDEPIAIGPFGEPTYCEGAFVQFTLGTPYTENIQWTLNGTPIPGANDQSLVVTTPGSYSVSGAPAECPNAITNLGLTLDVGFTPPTQPVIQAVDGVLCAVPEGLFHQWYLGGSAIIGANDVCYTTAQSGAYTVFADYGNNCQVISEPYLSTGMVAANERTWTLTPNPSSGLITVQWNGALPNGTYWSVTDRTGRGVRSGFMPSSGSLRIDLSDLPTGTYLFQAAHAQKALGRATRFTLAR